jgi:uncharacterized protein YjbI with pentapeptide repeats
MITTKMIGQKIAEARKKTEMSQARLAQLLFISTQAVGKWERGESMPDITTFNRLAEILGVDLNYFSEHFQSEYPESVSDASAVNQSDDLPTENPISGLRRDMSRWNWMDADFSGLKNLQEKFSSSNMKNCKFAGSDMSGLLLKSNHVDQCDFSGSDMSRSHFQTSGLFNIHFNDCSLKEAEFSGSSIISCDFRDADLTGVVIKSSALLKNTMTGAVLKHTSFNTTQIVDMVFDGTLNDCCFEYCDFKKVTFRNSTLINTFFKCRSLKKITFIDCRADRITYEFLKNGKADLSGIALLSS